MYWELPICRDHWLALESPRPEGVRNKHSIAKAHIAATSTITRDQMIPPTLEAGSRGSGSARALAAAATRSWTRSDAPDQPSSPAPQRRALCSSSMFRRLFSHFLPSNLAVAPVLWFLLAAWRVGGVYHGVYQFIKGRYQRAKGQSACKFPEEERRRRRKDRCTPRS